MDRLEPDRLAEPADAFGVSRRPFLEVDAVNLLVAKMAMSDHPLGATLDPKARVGEALYVIPRVRLRKRTNDPV